MVLKIDAPGPQGQPWFDSFPGALTALLEDGHCVTVVHGNSAQPIRSVSSNGKNGHAKRKSAGSDEDALIADIGATNKSLVCRLNAAGMRALGLCGADGKILRMRRKNEMGSGRESLEIASVDPFWLDVISQQQSVLVMANLGPGPDKKLHRVDAGELAAACAVAWRADALVFLTAYEGIRNVGGEVIRWLEAGHVEALLQSSMLSPEVLSHLKAGHEAIKHGVRRVRILPFSCVNSLSQFYFAKIAEGTELILSSA
jgi:acetylglutamate kinase